MTAARYPDSRHDPLELMTLRELARLAKLSRRKLELDIDAGRLNVVTFGKAIRVSRVEAERYLAGDAAPPKPRGDR